MQIKVNITSQKYINNIYLIVIIIDLYTALFITFVYKHLADKNILYY